jgi:hypothetical protein
LFRNLLISEQGKLLQRQKRFSPAATETEKLPERVKANAATVLLFTPAIFQVAL